MIVKTASEIIRQAKFLAQCENSDFLDDFTTTNIINEVYEEIYQDIITHTKNYLCTLDFNGEVLLPCNCYQIDSVVNKNTGVTIDRAPKAQSINGCYTIENQCLKVIGSGNEEYTLKYYPEPVTITTGPEPIKFDLIYTDEDGSEHRDYVEKVLAIRDDYFIYKNGTSLRKYTFDTKTLEDYHSTGWDIDPVVWKGQTIVTENSLKSGYLISIKINGVEKIDEFNKMPNPWWKPEFGEEEAYKYKQPFYIMSDGEDTLYITYLSITDVEGVGGVYETYEVDADGNYEIIASSLSKDPVYVGFNKLESGKGIIAYDLNNECYVFEGWMPDTILDFPVNIFYTVMEERIALLLASIVGVDNEYLKTDYKDRIEQQYYNALKRDDYSPTRIRNVLPARRF